MSQILTAVKAKLMTGTNNGDGLDHDSVLTFVLHPTWDGRRDADFAFYGNDGVGGNTHEGDTKYFDLTLHTSTLTKAQINHNYSIDVIINAVGRDHYAGVVQMTFYFSDGTVGGFQMTFAIGTYHESNQTGMVINFASRQFLDEKDAVKLFEPLPKPSSSKV